MDTSVPSAYFDERTAERLRLTREFWGKLEEFEVCVSELVLEELSSIRDAKLRTKALEIVKGFTILKMTPQVQEPAHRCIERGICSPAYEADALHMAFASANGLHFMVSWNFRHLVNVRTRRHVNIVNKEAGYREIEIVAPPEI
jgi:predicted nucleic acid-binding protein